MMNRRAFCRTNLIFAASFFMPCSFAKVSKDIILGGGQYFDVEKQQQQYFLSVIDIQGQQKHLTSMPFLPHGIHRRIDDPFILAIFEKQGPGACEYDLKQQKIRRMIPKLSNRYFYGHGSYSADATVLFSTETLLDSLDGVITIRDSSSLTHVGDFPSFGKEPHECKLIDQGKTLVVTNGGGPLNDEAPSICFIDIQQEKLIEKVTLTNERLNTGHFSVSDQGDLVVVSAPRTGLGKKHTGGVSIRPQGKAMQSIAQPQRISEKMFGEALSTCINNALAIAAVTHPDGDMITFWSLKDRQFIKAMKFDRPRGVVLSQDQKYFLVSAGQTGDLFAIEAKTLMPRTALTINSSYMTGSHIYNWSAKMTEFFSPGPFI